MASKFEVGDYVWAKMKGFPPWPAKVVEPKANMKKPSGKQKKTCVFFYGTENFAFILDELVWEYDEYKEQSKERTVPGFNTAVEAMDAAMEKSPPRPRPRPEESKRKKRLSSPGSSSSSSKKSRKSNGTDSSPKLPSHKSIESAIDKLKSKLDPVMPSEPSLFPDYLPLFDEGISPKNVIATPMKIGFLGLGTMGTGIVTNLLRSGHEVTVWNRTPSKCREFVKEGALKSTSPAEVIQDCDITFSCVSDPTALKDAVTVRGGRFLEAPIIGSKDMSCNGQLLIMAAGDHSLYEDCFSCFEAMGRKSFFLGEVGSASKMQLISGLCSSTVLAGLAESLALAEKVGLDQDQVLQILSMSSVNCQLIKQKGIAMTTSEFSDPHYKLHLCQKDLRLAVNMSDTVDQPLHVGAAVNELFKKAKSKGYGEHDVAAIYRAANL